MQLLKQSSINTKISGDRNSVSICNKGIFLKDTVYLQSSPNCTEDSKATDCGSSEVNDGDDMDGNTIINHSDDESSLNNVTVGGVIRKKKTRTVFSRQQVSLRRLLAHLS